MKRNTTGLLLALLLSASMVFPAAAESAEKTVTLSGKVIAGTQVTIQAPYGGIVEDFTLRSGDLVLQGDTLFSIETTKVYAPDDGVVRGVFVEPGDNSASAINRYGALMTIEPASPFVIDANTSEAYDKNANRIIHAGEMVYLVSTANSDRTGEGFVTKVDGKDYTVEVTLGNLRFDEKVSICRKDNHASSSRIGRGKTKRIAPIEITGEGSVVKLHVEAGEQVTRGQLLMELVGGELNGLNVPENAVTAQVTGIIARIDAIAGSAVVKDQTLAAIYPTKSFMVTADVNELDLKHIAIGDIVEIEVSALKDENLKGTVRSISYLNNAAEGDAEYTVYFDTADTAKLREGMTVSIYLKS